MCSSSAPSRRAPRRPPVSPAARSPVRLDTGKHVELLLDDTSLVVSLGRHGWMRWLSPDSDAADPTGRRRTAGARQPRALRRHRASGDGCRILGVTGTVRRRPPRRGPRHREARTRPGPPDFSRAEFDAALGGGRKQIKAILQEQESLAGIGNAYSDEILHLARQSPVTHAAALDAEATDLLFAATVTTVREAIEARSGVPIDQLKAQKVAAMRVHGRSGEACPVCGDAILDLTFSGSSAQYCPTCQPTGACRCDRVAWRAGDP